MLKFIQSFRIWKENPGVISDESRWCCIYDGVPGYLHIHYTLHQLLWEIVTEFRNDKHIIGY